MYDVKVKIKIHSFLSFCVLPANCFLEREKSS